MGWPSHSAITRPTRPATSTGGTERSSRPVRKNARAAMPATQGADTTLVVTPGQWRSLGAITVSERTGARGLSGGATHSERLDLPLEVKVEIGGR